MRAQRARGQRRIGNRSSPLSPQMKAINALVPTAERVAAWESWDAGYIFSDAAATVPIEDGQSVRGWKDIWAGKLISNNGLISTCPVYHADEPDINNNPTLEADGNDFLDAGFSNLCLPKNNSHIYVVLRIDSPLADTTNRNIFEEAGSANSANYQVIYRNSDDRMRFFFADNVGTTSTITQNPDFNNGAHLLECITSASNSRQQGADSTITAVNSQLLGTRTTDRFVLFGSDTAGVPAGAHIGLISLFMITSGQTNAAAIRALLSDIYSI